MPPEKKDGFVKCGITKTEALCSKGNIQMQTIPVFDSAKFSNCLDFDQQVFECKTVVFIA